MDPTQEEIDQFKSIDDVANWAGLSKGSSAEQPNTPRSTFYALLGVQPADYLRVLANIPESDLSCLIESWKVDGKAPTPAQVSQAALLGRGARIAAGLQPTLAQLRETAKEEHAQYREQKAQRAIEEAATDKANKVRLANVIDQGNDSEIALISTAELEQGYKEFSRRLGGLPEPEEEVTREQYSALKALFDSSCPPYTDFAVWGPFNRRLQKKLRLNGLVLGDDGTLKRTELYGPPTLEEWERSYRPFRTGCIMLSMIDPANLDLYANHIRASVQRFGMVAGPVIYQADVRARLEQIERVRRKAEHEHEQCIQKGGTSPFEPNRPWNFCFKMLVDDDKFWRKELEQPALLVLSRARTMSSALDGDAPITGGATASTHGWGGGPGGGTKRKQSHIRRHSTGEDGRLVENRSGKMLCDKWQDGTCQLGGALGKCPQDASKVHQCAICLAQDHGAKFCNRNPAKAPRNPKGKGKGKGKKGGWNRAPY